MRQLKISKQVTNREEESLDKYLVEIGRVDLITAEDEVSLAQRIRAGDQRALDKLVRANLRFVVSVAKQYQNQGLTLPDLINEGNLGLIKAAQRFDETRGFKFISYAVWWIRQSILQALAEHARVVRLPLNKIGYISKVNRAYSELEQKLERTPSYEELSELLDIPISDVRRSIEAGGRHKSLDAPLVDGDESSSNMYDMLENDSLIAPEDKLIYQSLQNEINRSLSTLTMREADVLKFFYGLDGYEQMSLDEIGFRFDLTRERVRQIREKAVKRLRHTSRSKALRTYLG